MDGNLLLSVFLKNPLIVSMCHLVLILGAITLIYSNTVSAILRFDPSPRYVIPSELNGKILKLAAQEVSGFI
jgi:hypothetical protein